MWTLHRKRRVETTNTNDDAKSERRGAALCNPNRQAEARASKADARAKAASQQHHCRDMLLSGYNARCVRSEDAQPFVCALSAQLAWHAQLHGCLV